ncbi:MAG: DUF1800 domain-containing protein [Bacteroidota bacterium]
MDRRTTLSTLLGRKKTKPLSSAVLTPSLQTGLTPYQGNWTFEQAAHLLRRTIFGPTKVEIEATAQRGLSRTIDLLFAQKEMPAPPINYNFDKDPAVPIGETWVNAVHTRGELRGMIRAYRNRSLGAWNIGQLINSEVSIREKMTLFWHNHFVVQASVVRDPIYIYNYISLLRENATGNFKELVKKVTIDPAMLRYLNGNQNSRVNPNENYARELMELFTVGKGELAGSGDYTTFTEDDVIEAAKILTGWRDFGYFSDNAQNRPRAIFVRNRHDRTDKTLSHRFGNAVIDNQDATEYEALIDLIFQQAATATFICRKLYRWFVYSEIDEAVEQQVITPMAELLVANDFEIAPVLKALLSSEHFFEASFKGPMIKNPMDFVIGLYRQTAINIDPTDRRSYTTWWRIAQYMPNLQMVYFDPPDVAGWKAYYQEPGFYQTWISSATLGPRMDLTNAMALKGVRIAGRDVVIDVLALAAEIENATDPNVLIDGLAKMLFPQPITDQQKAALKEVLIPGLPDFEWTVEYGDYLAHPDNEDLKTGAENRLRALLQAMLVMPEYYLM